MNDLLARLKEFSNTERDRVSECLESSLGMLDMLDADSCKFLMSFDGKEREALFLYTLCFAFRLSESIASEGRMVALALSSKHAKA